MSTLQDDAGTMVEMFLAKHMMNSTRTCTLLSLPVPLVSLTQHSVRGKEALLGNTIVHSLVQGGPSGRLNLPVDLHLGCSVTLPGQKVATVAAH